MTVEIVGGPRDGERIATNKPEGAETWHIALGVPGDLTAMPPRIQAAMHEVRGDKAYFTGLHDLDVE